jgi:hypothetical protein
MAGFNIDAYRANFQGGARSYLFYYKPIFPGGITGDTNTATYLVRSTSLPETSIDEIPLAWQGFDFKVAGKYTYSDWNVSFNCDSNADILGTFHNWIRLIHDPTSNMYNNPAVYMQDQQLELLSLTGEPIAKYKLFGAWPKLIGNSALDYTQNDVVQFDITFTYIYHTIDKATYAVQPTFG